METSLLEYMVYNITKYIVVIEYIVYITVLQYTSLDYNTGYITYI